MKLGPVTKIDKKNKSTSKNIVDDIMLGNCVVNVYFPIYDKFAAIRKPDSRRMVYKTCILINSNLLSYKT